MGRFAARKTPLCNTTTSAHGIYDNIECNIKMVTAYVFLTLIPYAIHVSYQYI